MHARMGHVGQLLRSAKGPIAFVGDTASKNYLIRTDGTYFNLAPPASSGTVSQLGVTFSKDNTMCATAFTANNKPGHQARIWRVADGVLLHSLATFTTGTPRRPRFSPDGQYLAFACSTGTPALAVFRTSDWSMVTLPNMPSRCDCLEWSPDGQYLVAGIGTTPYLRRWNVSDWTQASNVSALHQPGSNVYSMAFNPAGTQLAIGVAASPFAARYNWPELNVNTYWPSPPGASFSSTPDMSYSRDGKYLAIASDGGEKIYVYDVSNPGAPVKVATPASPAIGAVVLSAQFSKKANMLALVEDSGANIGRIYKNGGWQTVALPAGVTLDSTTRACAFG